MKHAIRVCNSFQRLLFVSSVILLVLIATTRGGELYRHALDEINALDLIRMETLERWINNRWNSQEENNRYLADFWFSLGRLIKTTKTEVDTKLLFGKAAAERWKRWPTETIPRQPPYWLVPEKVRHAPYTAPKVTGWDGPVFYVPLPPDDERRTVDRVLHYLDSPVFRLTIATLPKLLLPLPSIQLDSTATLVGVTAHQKPVGEERIRSLDEHSYWNLPDIVLHIRRGAAIERHDVSTFEMESTTTLEFGLRAWLEVYQVDVDRYISATTSFPHLRKLQRRIGHMDFGNAKAYLRDALRQQEQEVFVRLWGTSFRRDLIETIGPVLLWMFMIGLLGTMQHLVTVRKCAQGLPMSGYWGALSPSLLARGVSWASVSVLPSAVYVVALIQRPTTPEVAALNFVGLAISVIVLARAITLPTLVYGDDKRTVDG